MDRRRLALLAIAMTVARLGCHAVMSCSANAVYPKHEAVDRTTYQAMCVQRDPRFRLRDPQI